MAENGANEYDIQAHLRHKSVRSTEIYVHITSKKKYYAVEKYVPAYLI